MFISFEGQFLSPIVFHNKFFFYLYTILTSLGAHQKYKGNSRKSDHFRLFIFKISKFTFDNTTYAAKLPKLSKCRSSFFGMVGRFNPTHFNVRENKLMCKVMNIF